jgi:hypoxanthine phosphoribosyltransferase
VHIQDVTSPLFAPPISLSYQRLRRSCSLAEHHYGKIAAHTANRKAYVTYEKIELFIDSVREQILSHSFDAIACVLRGGMFPAMCVAYATGLPIYFIRYDRATQTPSWVTAPPTGKLLICEDYAGSGHTLEHVIEFITATHPAFEILTAIKDNKSRRKPRWAIDFGDQTTVLPWERDHHAQTARFTAEQVAANRAASDHTARFTGYDLDGIFCADIDASEYVNNLHDALQRRDLLAPLQPRPVIDPTASVIITGRPIQDAVRTRTWITTHLPEAAAIAVLHRDPTKFDGDATGAAQHKAAAALAAGCTEFVESCPHQSLLIAQAVPWLRVRWWNSGTPVFITATGA